MGFLALTIQVGATFPNGQELQGMVPFRNGY